MSVSRDVAAPLEITVDRSSATPLYLQLAGAIEEAVRSGVLPPGSRLENELALAQRLGLSRPTVRQGIQELVDKGMLVRKRGVGTQVVQAPVHRQVALTSLYDDLRTAGKAPRTEIVEYRIGRPGPEAVDRLQLGSGEQVLDLLRVRYADGEPLAVMRNMVPERIAPPARRSPPPACTPPCGSAASRPCWPRSGSAPPSPTRSTPSCWGRSSARPC